MSNYTAHQIIPSHLPKGESKPFAFIKAENVKVIQK